MKKVKPKKVSTKAPRPSASKPTAKDSARELAKSFESTTQFNDGTFVEVVGFNDGSMNIYQKHVGGLEEVFCLPSTVIAAFMRTMAKKMVTDGIKLEDFL
jgi:hypothetical protein